MATYSTYDEKNQVLIEYEDTEMVDSETGEVVPVLRMNKKFYGNANFDKVFVKEFLAAYDVIQNKQVAVVNYIYNNMNRAENMFVGTYKKIAADVGVSEPTIASIMRKLQEKNILRKVQNGVWQINPRIIVRGSESKRRALITMYEDCGVSKPPLLEEIENEHDEF